jgi:hypothetical protein
MGDVFYNKITNYLKLSEKGALFFVESLVFFLECCNFAAHHKTKK